MGRSLFLYPAPMSRHRVFGMIVVVAALTLLEVLLRLVFPVPEVLGFNRVTYSMVGVDDSRRTGLANASFTWASEPDGVEFVHRLNLYGFRDTDWRVTKSGARPRVLFVGDSFVEGIMAPQGATIPDHFERLSAAAGRPVEALNMGVSAAGVPEYLALLLAAVPLFQPDDAVVVFYAADLPAGLEERPAAAGRPVAVFSSPWQPRLLYVLQRLRRGLPVPRAWSGRPFPFLAPVPSERNPWSSPQAERWERFVSPVIADAMKRARFNPYVVDAYGRFRERLQIAIEPEEMLSLFEDLASQGTTRLLLVYLPDRNQVSDAYLEAQSEYSRDKAPTSLMTPEYQVHARALAEASAALGIPFLDLTPKLRTAEARGRRLYWRYDQHLTEEGYAFAAAAIYEWRDSLTRERQTAE